MRIAMHKFLVKKEKEYEDREKNPEKYLPR